MNSPPQKKIASDICLWSPSKKQIDDAEVNKFATFVQARTQFDWQRDFQLLWKWSVDNIPEFWDALWDWHGILGHKGGRILTSADNMREAKFFPDAEINFAENLLIDADDRPAITHSEGGHISHLTRAELKQKVLMLAGWLQKQGIASGDPLLLICQILLRL